MYIIYVVSFSYSPLSGSCQLMFNFTIAHLQATVDSDATVYALRSLLAGLREGTRVPPRKFDFEFEVWNSLSHILSAGDTS